VKIPSLAAICFFLSASLAAAQVPSVPRSLSFMATDSTVQLVWMPPMVPAGLVGYVVEAGSNPGDDNVAIVHMETATGLTAQGVPPGVYYVRVRGKNSRGVGPASNEIMVTVQSTCSPPYTPAGLVHRVTGSTLAFSWNSLGLNHLLEVGSSPGFSDLAILQAPGRSLTLHSVPNGNYYVRVRGRNDCGVQSLPTNEVLVRVR
jgi:hypothetical protein